MNYKKTVSVIMAVLLLMGLAGCAGNEKKKSNGEKEEIAIPRSEEHTSELQSLSC